MRGKRADGDGGAQLSVGRCAKPLRLLERGAQLARQRLRGEPVGLRGTMQPNQGGVQRRADPRAAGVVVLR